MSTPDAVSERERRVIGGGALIVVIALLLTYAVVPFARQWMIREAEMAAVRDRVAFLEALSGRAGAIEAAASADERTLSSKTRRVLHARSATLAASAVQALLQDMADASAIAVTRLEVSADDTVGADVSSGSEPVVPSEAGSDAGPAGTAVGLRIPAMLSAYGDISGVARFLDLLGSGPRVMVLERLTVQRNAALIGAPDVVQITATLRAPVIPE